MPTDTLLLEIGTEELPPRSLKQLMLGLEQNLSEQLASAGFTFGKTRSFATPRRLAVVIDSLADKQDDQQIEKRGPPVKAAYDGAGNPTEALLGFIRSCGVGDHKTLERLTSDKGEWVVFRGTRKGKSIQEEIGHLISNSIADLPIDRKMRWGSHRLEFVRPVHWVVLLYGSEIIPALILGQAAGRTTKGHRFMSDGECEISTAGDYSAVLEKAAVVADFEQRQQQIREQLKTQASLLKGNLEIDEALLEEVTALVELPCALSGSFEASFLDVPEEASICKLARVTSFAQPVLRW